MQGMLGDVGSYLLSSLGVFVVFVDEGIMKESLMIYPKYGGRLSLTDNISVEVMRRYGSKEIFSYDSDIVKNIRRRDSL